MHIHLDLTGGIAGDMFCAAMLDAFPNLEEELLTCIQSLNLQDKVQVSLQEANDKGIFGKRFSVSLAEDNHHHHHHHHHHEHHSWKHIRSFILNSDLDEDIKENAIGIFSLLAEAEAKIHGSSVDDVEFHEVGAWDCIVDIISASFLVVNSNTNSWSVSKVPWGGGLVKCAHGIIPVPSPATVNLLSGFEFTDDGEEGERVTPTGAAILAWLKPSRKVATGDLITSGYGIGTRKLALRANIVRVVVSSDKNNANREKLSLIQCDIDDMSGEDLAIARENIRNIAGVLDINEAVSHGKKNRLISTLTIMCEPISTDEIIRAVLTQTSTIGARTWECDRISLKRKQYSVNTSHGTVYVKTVKRPSGEVTSKIEADHLNDNLRTFKARRQLKIEAENIAEEVFK